MGTVYYTCVRGASTFFVEYLQLDSYNQEKSLALDSMYSIVWVELFVPAGAAAP